MKKVIKLKRRPKAAQKQNAGKEVKYIPFKYINEQNLRQLIYLIRRETPQMIALVVSYLKPEYVHEILTSLPPELQAQVAIEMATVRLMTQQQLMEYDSNLKKKIDYVIGGLDNLLQVLEKVDKTTLDNILDYLKNENPDLYEKVRKFIITFEDIPTFPDQAVQVIIRELKSESLARALKDANPEILNKIFTNMSASAAAMLKEEMEYGRQATPEEIEEERKKMLELIKQLEKDGKVFIREKPKSAILEGAGEVVDGTGSSGAGSESFNEYFNAGAQSYEAGQYEEAISYFEYCAQLDPNQEPVYQYLGGAYYALGRTQEAIDAYEKALAINPDNQELRAWIDTEKNKIR